MGVPTSAPARIFGSINPLRSSAGTVVTGAVDSTQRTTNGTILQTAFSSAASQGKFIEIDPVRVEYNVQTVSDGVNCGLYYIGTRAGIICASMETKLIQYATNHPALTIGHVGPANSGLETYWGLFRNIHVGYGVSQTGQTSAAALLLGSHFLSQFENIQVDRFISGSDFHPYVGIRVSPTNGKCFFFSCSMNGLVNVNGSQLSFIEFRANTTGNNWDSIYLGGGGVGNRVALSGPAFNTPSRYNLAFGSINQLNIEWCTTSQLLVNTTRGMQIGNFHIEGTALSGFSPSLISSDSAVLDIRNLDMLNPWIASANASGTPTIVSHFGDGAVHIDNMVLQADGGTEQFVSLPIQVIRDDTGAPWRNSSLKVNRMALTGAGVTGTVALDNNANTSGVAITANGAIIGHNGFKYNPSLSMIENANIVMNNANLTVYGRNRNARVEAVNALTADRTLILSDRLAASGAGSASVRASGDIIRVRRTGAGAFNLIVQNHLGSTLHTFTGAGSANTERSFEWSGSAFSAL